MRDEQVKAFTRKVRGIVQNVGGHTRTAGRWINRRLRGEKSRSESARALVKRTRRGLSGSGSIRDRVKKYLGDINRINSQEARHVRRVGIKRHWMSKDHASK